MVGKSVHPLFVHASKEKRGEPIETESATDPSWFIGNYQLGIHSVIPDTTPPFSFRRVMFKPRVPTSTLLVRMVKATVDPATG